MTKVIFVAFKVYSLDELGCSLTRGGIGAPVGTPADAALVRMQADTKLPVEQRSFLCYLEIAKEIDCRC